MKQPPQYRTYPLHSEGFSFYISPTHDERSNPVNIKDIIPYYLPRLLRASRVARQEIPVTPIWEVVLWMSLITHPTRCLKEHSYSRESDEEIHCPFYHRPRSEEQIDDIEVLVDISSYPDESPVQRTDEHQDIRQEMHTTESVKHIRHREEG